MALHYSLRQALLQLIQENALCNNSNWFQVIVLFTEYWPHHYHLYWRQILHYFVFNIVLFMTETSLTVILHYQPLKTNLTVIYS